MNTYMQIYWDVKRAYTRVISESVELADALLYAIMCGNVWTKGSLSLRLYRLYGWSLLFIWLYSVYTCFDFIISMK